VYCFKKLNKKNKTRDHVFPRSWFPDKTPCNLNRWVVPSCNICNYKFQLVEEDLFIRWGIGIDPAENSAIGISNRVLNKINLESTDDERRLGRKFKTIKSIIKDFSYYDPQKTLKGLTPKESVRSTLAVRIPQENLQSFGEKIIKGLEYKLRKKLIRNNQLFSLYYVYENDNYENYYNLWDKLISTNEHNIDLGPAFIIKYGVDPKNSNTVIYKIKIWNHIEFWGWIYEKIKQQ